MESLEGQLTKVLKGSNDQGFRVLTAFHHGAAAVSENGSLLDSQFSIINTGDPGLEAAASLFSNVCAVLL